ARAGAGHGRRRARGRAMSPLRTEAATDLKRQIDETARALGARTRMRPEVAVILGTGLGTLAEGLQVETRVPYAEVPHFAVSTVESHAGELVFGRLAGRPAVVMNGRVHYYEGYSMRQVAFPVRVARALGAHTLIVTNACGGMHPLLDAGDLVV